MRAFLKSLSFRYIALGLAFNFLLLSNNINAQVTINHPIDGAVYQRSGGNPGNANLAIAGAYSISPASSVQARLVTPNTNSPIAGFDWTIIDSSPNKGNYYGYLFSVPPGWYTLQVRVLKSGVQLQSAQINRVGIGDVFLIAGQSNAQGWNSTGIVGSSDERVRTHNAFQGCNAVIPGYPLIEQLNTSSKLAITGENAWCYGRLGDTLVGQTGFPTAFINAGASGTSIENWETSSNGGATNHPFINVQYCGVLGSPYQDFFTKSLRYYHSLFGIRAILWHQGESDTHLKTTAGTYQSKLTSVINKSRIDFGGTIPWVVSRASYYNGSTNSGVITGQNNTISTITQVYAGPSTDDITTANFGSGHRDDDVHFNDQGLITLANRWKSSLNSSFFNSSNAISHETTPTVQVAVNGANVTLTAPSGYSAYKWVNTINYNATTLSTSHSLTQSTGIYVCFLTDANGNITFTQSVDVSAVKNRIDNNVACSSSVFLSDLKPYNQVNGFGPIEFDQHGGGNQDGDGGSFVLNGIGFSKGIGVHSNSEIIYNLPSGKFFNFQASIGIDDSDATGGSATFQVFKVLLNGSNQLLGSEHTLNGSSATVNLNLDISSVTRLKLVVLSGSSQIRANWANAILTCGPPDTTPPTMPTALINTDSLTKCSTFSWVAATDNIGVSQYNIYKDGSYQTSIPGGQTTYTLSGLNTGSNFTFGVQARDAAGYTSAIANISGKTINMTYTYPLFNDVCVGDTYQAAVTPTGGSFQVLNTNQIGSYNLNSVTGDLTINSISSPSNGMNLRYTVEQGTVCEDSFDRFARGNTKPSPTSITGTDTLINIGTVANFTALSCGVNATTWFQFTGGSSLSLSPTDTTMVYAFCRNNGCYSDTSNVIQVKVIPDCPSNFALSSTKDDLPGTKNALFFKASDAVEADNDLTLQAVVNFTAGKEIILKPGFKADSGTVFSAKIEGCP